MRAVRALQFLLTAMFVTRSVRAFASTQARVAAQPKVAASTVADIHSRVFDSDKRPVVLFDGVCNFCNTWVNAALQLDPDGTAIRCVRGSFTLILLTSEFQTRAHTFIALQIQCIAERNGQGSAAEERSCTR